MELTIEKHDPVRVVAMRHIGPYQECHQTWMKMLDWMIKNNLMAEGTQSYGASYDDPSVVPEDQLRYDCCFSVAEDFTTEDKSVEIRTLPGGEYAVYKLKGSYSLIGPTFGKMFTEGLPTIGRKCKNSPCLEIYRTDPAETPEDQNITDLLIPLK